MYVFMFLTGVIWTIAMGIIVIYVSGKITKYAEKRKG